LQAHSPVAVGQHLEVTAFQCVLQAHYPV
jgi:hypothetical protein